MTPATIALWEQSTTTWPRAFDSDNCWTGPKPSFPELYLATQNKIADLKVEKFKQRSDIYPSSDKGVYIPAFVKGEMALWKDPSEALLQLLRPNPANPMALVGFRLPEDCPDHILTTPPALSEIITPADETNLQIVLTPKFWVTDLHIGMSSPGKCKPEELI